MFEIGQDIYYNRRMGFLSHIDGVSNVKREAGSPPPYSSITAYRQDVYC